MKTTAQTDDNDRKGIGRRGFVSGIIVAVLACISSILGVGAVRFLTPPPRRRRVTRKKLSQPAPPLGTAIADSFNDQPIIIYREQSGKLHAYIGICPHLGCPLEYDPDRKLIVCPCHDGIFDTSGKRISGPAASSLVSLGVENKGGTIYVMDISEESVRG